MRICFGNKELSFRNYETLEEVTRCFSKSSSKTIILGGKIDHPLKFYGLSWKATDAEKYVLRIGILTSFEIEPALIFSKELDSIFIGYDRYVSKVNVVDSSKLFDIELESPFYNFINYLDKVVVVYETGIFSLTTEGKIIWDFRSGDIIRTFRIQNESIYIYCLEGDEFEIALESGCVRK